MTQKIIKYLAYFFPIISPAYLIKLPISQLGSINLLDVYLTFFLCCFFFYIIRKDVRGKGIIFLKENKKLLVLSFLFILGFAISYITNFSPRSWTNGLGVMKSYLILPITFSWALSFLVKENTIKQEKLFFSYFIYTALLEVLGIAYFLLDKLTYDSRLALFFESPNQLAISLAPGIIIGVFFLRNSFYTKRHLIISISVAVQIFCLLLTKSSGAWIGLIFVFFLAFISSKMTFSFSSLIIPICITTLLLLLSTGSILKIFNYQPSAPPTSTNSRLAIYSSGEKILKDSFLLGIGPGNFQEKYLEYQKYFPPYPQWAVPHAHNLFFHTWIEGGILSLLALIALITIKLNKKTTSPIEPALLIVIYFLIHGLVDTTIWKNDLSTFFWLFLFLI